MTSAELLVDAVGRIRGAVHRAVDGLTPEQLAFRLDPETNSIAWLVWHLPASRTTTSETLAARGATARPG